MSAAVEVRVNLWKAGTAAVVWLGAAFACFTVVVGASGFLTEVLFGAVGGALLMFGIDAAELLWFKRFLKFEPEAGRITLRPGTNRLAAYPSKGFERVEYSLADGRIYEVRADGRHRRLPVRRRYMNRTDWEALVGVLIEHRSGM
jgi:hypothetical protein